jgi:hypothetical protein
VSSIDLNNNNIDSLGALKIAEYLESDPPVHQINLDHNLLNDDDVILISQALRRNMTLKRLDLDGNNFTSFGAKALLTCVFDGSSLKAISESNHTLIEMNMFYIQDRRHFNLAGCIDRFLRLDCTQKIIVALQDKDSLLQYLANVPVGLIPEVMVFPLRRVVNSFFYHPLHIPNDWFIDDLCQISNLNIVYSTMRWWNMPMLYSYHNGAKSDAKRKRND